ncbi:MAG: hypothetical protein U9N85_02700 [Bacteroidota bacterium]|nr:hypothetical protein [Bacteroidota bacterium]
MSLFALQGQFINKLPLQGETKNDNSPKALPWVEINRAFSLSPKTQTELI